MIYTTLDYVVLGRKSEKRSPVVTPLNYVAMSMYMGFYFTQAMVTCYTNVLRSSLQLPLKYE